MANRDIPKNDEMGLREIDRKILKTIVHADVSIKGVQRVLCGIDKKPVSYNYLCDRIGVLDMLGYLERRKDGRMSLCSITEEGKEALSYGSKEDR